MCEYLYIGAPKGATMVRAEDSLILCGRSAAVGKPDGRKTGISGELDHVRSVEEQREVQKKEAESDPEAGSD